MYKVKFLVIIEFQFFGGFLQYLLFSPLPLFMADLCPHWKVPNSLGPFVEAAADNNIGSKVLSF